LRERVRIAVGQGFWGDLQSAPLDQVSRGPVDYLVMDFLAEVTMSILQKQKKRSPDLGYAKDVLKIVEQILPLCLERNIRIITNGGGANPQGCCAAILRWARKKDIRGLKIGIVHGDDILENIDDLHRQGIRLDNMDSRETIDSIGHRFLSANVYFGAMPIVEALGRDAHIVITGRTTDTGLTLAPMVHEFGWACDDWDRLAAGTVAGHILECGGQASGGNFSADWKNVPDLAHIGFPIAEAYPSGDIVITKHDGTGGLVNVQTVSEQLLYEIGDPTAYITPDCIADFTTIHLDQVGQNRVRLSGVKGRPATEFYKVSMSYVDGYTAIGTLTYAWPEALEKARAADSILRRRLADLGLTFEEIRTEFLGYNSCLGPLSVEPDQINEVVLRVGVRSHDHTAVERFGMELAPLILTGPPAVTGFAGGRPKPSEVIAYWPALIPKSAVEPEVLVEES
jgi:hypothetical protein